MVKISQAVGGRLMAEKRSGKDRRVRNDREKDDASSYNGPEKRAIKYRRSDKDRRKKD